MKNICNNAEGSQNPEKQPTLAVRKQSNGKSQSTYLGISVFVCACALPMLPNLTAAVLVKPFLAGIYEFVTLLSLLLIPAALTRCSLRTWVVFSSPFALIAPAMIAFQWTTKARLTKWDFMLLFEATPDEASVFRKQALWAVVGAMFVLALCLTLIRWHTARKLRIPPWFAGLAAVAFCIPLLKDCLVSGPSPALRLTVGRLSSAFPVSPFLEFYKARQIKASILRRGSLVLQGAVGRVSEAPAPNQRELYLLVIGESVRAGSLHMDGNQRQTTPELGSVSNLVNFINVTAPATLTMQSVPMIITGTEPNRFMDAFQRPSLVTVFNRAGFKTHWLSTQPLLGTYAVSASFGAEASSSVYLSKFLIGAEQINPKIPLDTELLPYVREILNSQEKKIFCVIHIEGSHVPYPSRYPQNFNPFGADREICHSAIVSGAPFSPEAQDHLTRAYDNTVAFTDHFLMEVIKLLDKESCPAFLWYIPDHGENKADAPVLPCAHGVETEDVLRVPMMAWFSDSWIQSTSFIYKRMVGRAATPITSPATFYTILQLAGIDSTCCNTTKSLASDQYVSPNRTILLPDGTISDFEHAIAHPISHHIVID